MKIDLPLLNSKPRSCGTCTKCCEGYLTGTIKGHQMKPGTPCYFLEQGVGCKDYAGRPPYPCKTFSCSWLDDKKMPDEYKPEVCKVIMKSGELHGTNYIHFVSAPDDPSEEMIAWAKKYFEKKNMNFVYLSGTAVMPVGTKEFIRLIKTHKDNFKKPI
jgi:hypothetical protein